MEASHPFATEGSQRFCPPACFFLELACNSGTEKGTGVNLIVVAAPIAGDRAAAT